ncbi:MAG: gamma-glutamyl hercynylcysteine S-oxide synthase [Acidimicrobiaceae bacterium]|nr:gamma-glutamyl hercynylcysteine S-oxide synthase [Acidimicrobiaceae bacterium]
MDVVADARRDLGGIADIKQRSANELAAVRRRSLDLLAPLDEGALTRQHSQLMSPLVWDLAHVGNYEDLWLVRAAGARPGVAPALDEMYDAFRHGRADRPGLPLLDPVAARRYIGDVRGRALEVVEAIEFDPAVPLLADGFVVGLVVQHEHQHDETMLATLQLMDGDGYRPMAAAPPVAVARPARDRPGEVLVPAGPFEMGTDDEAWAYDNERPGHLVDLPAFWIDRWPVTNAEFQAFIVDGSYHRPDLWSRAGWDFQVQARLGAPKFWRREGGTWLRTRFGWIEEVPADEAVQHVSWYEADAFARWTGKRLPTEQEWEKAARWSPERRDARRFPWGDKAPSPDVVNLGGLHFRPAPVGAYPEGAAPCGAEQLLGDVWEWTASDFAPYPGFASFPYREYSEVFFGPDYKVLRGGSWATHPSALRTTFRNWDYPIRRQIFAGFRCARDA